MPEQQQADGPTATSANNPAGLPTLVIIPTYNERENIATMLEQLHAANPGVDVLIADDNSPDGTGAIADQLAETDPRISVMHRPGKQGLGAAYISGFQWALERGYEVVVEMDADGSHRAVDLPSLLAEIPKHDLVLGSRWVPGGSVENWPKHRKWLSRGGNLYARTALKVDLNDATGGFRAFRAATLRDLDLEAVQSQGYCFQVDLAYRTAQQGKQVAEVPITFVEREHGTSKMSNKIVAEALYLVTLWGIRDRFARGRQRLTVAKQRRALRKQGGQTASGSPRRGSSQ